MARHRAGGAPCATPLRENAMPLVHPASRHTGGRERERSWNMRKNTIIRPRTVAMGILGASLLLTGTVPAHATTIGLIGVSNAKLAWVNGYQVVSGEYGWPVGGRGGCTVRRIGNEIGLADSCTTQFWDRSLTYGTPDIIVWQLGNSVAPDPVPAQDVRVAFMMALDWFDVNFPESRLILTTLPDYDDSAPCRGGQEYWYDFEVSNSLINWAVANGRAERADLDWPMYFLEDVRLGDPDCMEKYGKCDSCHQNDARIEEDGWTIDAYLDELIPGLGN
jgi:hypothetical protein